MWIEVPGCVLSRIDARDFGGGVIQDFRVARSRSNVAAPAVAKAMIRRPMYIPPAAYSSAPPNAAMMTPTQRATTGSRDTREA